MMRNSLLAVLILLLPGCDHPGEPVVDADFPGGNIIVHKNRNDSLWIAPDLSGIDSEWFYWYFRVRNIEGRTLTFKSTLENQFTSFGPAFSLNDNRHWSWIAEHRVVDNAFTISFTKKDTVAFFCTAIPYTEIQLREFIDQQEKGPVFDIQTLAITKQGRAVEALLIPTLYPEPSARVLLTARHHACEMMASYVMEGIIAGLLNDPELEALREEVEFMLIPFMDKDGVENGEQGKNRLPRDHNRDYEHPSLHASTSTLREKIPAWSVRFSTLVENNNTGELKFRNQDFLPFNTAWNTDKNHLKGKTFAQWAGSLENIELASTIEFPYGNVLGKPVSVDNAREFGSSLARSIRDYLEE